MIIDIKSECTVYFTPALPWRHIASESMASPPEIFLDISYPQIGRKFFTTFDTVKGVVHFSPSSEVPVSRVSIAFIGTSRTELSGPMGTTTDVHEVFITLAF